MTPVTDSKVRRCTKIDEKDSKNEQHFSASMRTCLRIHAMPFNELELLYFIFLTAYIYICNHYAFQFR